MWDELGIAPCDDPRAIRRAYAARLKKLDPDRDPEAFARLRGAFEWALNESRRKDDLRPSAVREPPPSLERDADPDQDGHGTATRPQAETARAEPAAEHCATSATQSTKPVEGAQDANFQSWATPDHDDVRDQALLVALDGALRRGEAAEATALFYRAAATGALSLESAPNVIARLLALAVDDVTLSATAFRHLTRTVGLDTPQSRVPVNSALRQRVLARLAAEEWYEDLLAKAERKWRRERAARRQAKIARLLLRRIGRHWHPRVDKMALKSWIDQYKIHKDWLGNRIDPAWVSKLEGRLRRREIFWFACFTLFIGTMLSNFVWLSAIAVIEGKTEEPLWALMVGPFLVAFFLWIWKLLVVQLLNLSFPGWRGFAVTVHLRDWAGRSRTMWGRLRTKGPGAAG
jgi:hypothetical protein